MLLERIAGWLPGGIDALRALGGADRIFLALAAAVVVLVLVAVVFGLVTIGLGFRSAQRSAQWARVEATWIPVLLDVLAEDARPEELWALVGDADRTVFVEFLLRYAHRLRGRELETVRELAAPYLERVARTAREGDTEERANAVQMLGILGLEGHEAVVARALDDPAPFVAIIAARTLARAGSPGSVGLVLTRLRSFRSWRRPFLADMLASAGTEAVPELEAVLADPDRTPHSRAICAAALTQIESAGSADPAAGVLGELEDLRGDPAFDSELAITTLRLLRQVGSPDHAPAVRGFTDHPHPVVRGAAFAALGRIGHPRIDAPILVEFLQDPEPHAALRAARALVELGVREPLERMAAQGERAAASAAAAGTSGERAPGPSIPRERVELAREVLAS